MHPVHPDRHCAEFLAAVPRARRCARSPDGFDIELPLGRSISPREGLRLVTGACGVSLVYCGALIGIGMRLPPDSAAFWFLAAGSAGLGLLLVWVNQLSRRTVRIAAHGDRIRIDDASYPRREFTAFAVLGTFTVSKPRGEDSVEVEIGRIGYVVDGQSHEIGTLRRDLANRVVPALNRWLAAAVPAHPGVRVET
jgi:hypothetical protein